MTEFTGVQTYQKYDLQLSACSQCRVHPGLASWQADANGSSVHDLKLFISTKVSQRPLGSSLQFDKIILTDLQARAHSKGAMSSTPLQGEAWVPAAGCWGNSEGDQLWAGCGVCSRTKRRVDILMSEGSLATAVLSNRWVRVANTSGGVIVNVTEVTQRKKGSWHFIVVAWPWERQRFC